MTNVTVYDPAMCCSTGICGAEVGQQLVTFAADLDWLKSKGIEVTRINLSQEPAKFAENGKVKAVLESAEAGRMKADERIGVHIKTTSMPAWQA